MIYRIASEKDIPSLVVLMDHLGYVHTNDSLLHNLRKLEEYGGAVFVACLNDEVIGCVTAIMDVRFAGGACGEIVSLVVLPSGRRQGVGKGLVSYAESWLKDKTDIIRVRANVIRHEAHVFYKDLGYEEEKSQKVFKKNA